MPTKKYYFIGTILCCACLSAARISGYHTNNRVYPSVTQQQPIPLFNGKNLAGWYSYIQYQGNHPHSTNSFSVTNGMLHIDGPDPGYLATEQKFSNFHLIAEFKWGTKKYPPRANDKRDNGILYFVSDTAKDKIWPTSVEYQIQEEDCGDFWLIHGATVEVNGKRTEPGAYIRVAKYMNAEMKSGKWNRVEIIANQNKLTHILNGVVVNEAVNSNLKTGRILIQAEYAEIYYRKIEIQIL